MEIYHNRAQANKSENFTMLGRPYLGTPHKSLLNKDVRVTLVNVCLVVN